MTDEAEKVVEQAYDACFKTDAGRRVLAHLCAMFHIRSTTMAADEGVAFQEGQRSVVLFILDQLDPPPSGAPEEDRFIYLRQLFADNFPR